MELSGSRRLQVTLASVLTATRFKYFDKTGALLPTKCSMCSCIDGPEHLLSHCDPNRVPGDPEACVWLLVQMAGRAEVINPHIPRPMLEDWGSAGGNGTDGDGVLQGAVVGEIFFRWREVGECPNL